MKTLQQVTESEPAKQVLSLWSEFKDFAFKGNVVDLAIGMVVGAAFARIVESLVKNIIMPVIGAILPGNQSYKTWSFTFNGSVVTYGEFLAEVINFLLLAALLFLFIVKFLGWLIQAKKAAAGPTKQEELLAEIRDLLRQRESSATSAGTPGQTQSVTGQPTR